MALTIADRKPIADGKSIADGKHSHRTPSRLAEKPNIGAAANAYHAEY